MYAVPTIHLRLNRTQAIDLYESLLKFIAAEGLHKCPPEIFEILAMLQKRLADFEMSEHRRRYGRLSCPKCQAPFAEKRELVQHIQECMGVELVEALNVVHNHYRPTLILEGR